MDSRNVPHLGTVPGDGAHWVIRRNCSVSPVQLGWAFVGLCLVSLSVGVFFWSMGATLVLPFTALELVVVAVAFLVYARHATDRESIRLMDGVLVVEQELAGKTCRSEFSSFAVQIEPRVGGDRLIEVRGGGKAVQVGRFLRSDLRPVLANEMRRALRGG